MYAAVAGQLKNEKVMTWLEEYLANRVKNNRYEQQLPDSDGGGENEFW